jgi:hypothetical protein
MPAPSPDPPADASPLGVERRRRAAAGKPPPDRHPPSARPEPSTSPAPARPPAPESLSTSEELHLAAERWAAMIVDAYLRHLAAAEREEEP